MFDGAPPKEKTTEIQQRIAKKNNIKTRIEELNNSIDKLEESKKKNIYIEIIKKVIAGKKTQIAAMINNAIFL